MKKWIPAECREGLVSVIVPCYNRAGIVTETLESVWLQSYRPVELIIVDDGSTDDSRTVVDEWVNRKNGVFDRDFSIRMITQENGGASKARNTGLMACGGEYIQFVDSDDLLHHEKLSIQVAALREHKTDFCVCNYKHFRESAEDDDTIVDFFSRSHSINDFPLVYPMDTPAPLFRRGAIINAGEWNTSLRVAEDFEYNFRLLCRGARGIWLDQALVYVRKHHGTERLQAAPLRGRYRSMYHGLAEMEMEAVESGRCTKRLLRSLGMRALMYHEHMKAESEDNLPDIFFRYAKSRVPMWRIALFLIRQRFWKPLWRQVYPKGPRALMRGVLPRR